MEWYDDLPHIGYDVNGRKIFRPAKGDELDKFLANVEDPAAWTSVEDKLLQQQVQLSDKELDIIRRLERAENPDADYDPYVSSGLLVKEWRGRYRLVLLLSQRGDSFLPNGSI
jgi:ribosome biogenesis protein ERB1